MAIRKQKLVEETRALRTKVDCVENEIDAQLRTNFGNYFRRHDKYPDEGNTIGAAVDLCVSLSEEEIQEILRRYEEAGWWIEFRVDQRDGAFFILQ